MVSFNEEKQGYDKRQVEQYIEKVESAYESVYEEIKAKNQDLEKADETIRELKRDRDRLEQKIEMLSKGNINNDSEQLAETQADLRKAFDLIQKLKEENDLLRANNRDLIAQRGEKSSRDDLAEIGAVMVKAEISAKDTVDRAKIKASQIVTEAEMEKEKVESQKRALQGEIFELGQRFNRIMGLSDTSLTASGIRSGHREDAAIVGGSLNGKKSE